MQSEARHYPRGHAWCRNPERYHSADSDATEEEVTELAAAFIRALQPEIVIETGTYTAQTTVALGQALEKNGHGHLWSLEVLPGLVRSAKVKCAKLPVTIVHSKSMDWLPGFVEEIGKPVDFMWCDSEAERVREVEFILPYMRPHAIIGVHDSAIEDWRWPFYQEMKPLFESGKLTPITLRTPRGVTFAQVNP